MSYSIRHMLPTPDQWMRLRRSVGWAAFEEEAVIKSLAATLFCVCAFDKNEMIGMGRVLGDGVISFYIGNVMVLPERQGEGIGREILQEIMKWVEENAAPGAIASLLSIKGKEDFYMQFGFEARPDEHHGCGMSRYF